MSVVAIRFDAQEEVACYLGKHPRTSGVDKKVVDAVAEFFAGKVFAVVAIDTLVTLRLAHLVSPKDKADICANITAALRDYGASHPVSNL